MSISRSVRTFSLALAILLAGLSTASASLTISTGSDLPDGTVGVAYSTTVTASGGTAPYTWAIVLEDLPPGLTLSPGTPTCTISGTPVSIDVDTFVLQVMDALGQIATRSFTIRIASNSSNLPRGKFRDVTSTYFPTTTDDSYAIRVDDLDADGYEDLILINSAAQDRQYRNSAGTSFTDATAGNMPVETSDGRDVDTTTSGSLLIANSGTQNFLWERSGGTFTDQTSAGLPSDTDTTEAVETGDVDGDFDKDVVFGNNGQSRFLINRGFIGASHKFVDRTALDFPTASMNTRDLSFGDVDGDGDRDLLLVNHGGERDRLYLNQTMDPALRGFSLEGRVFTADSTYSTFTSALTGAGQTVYEVSTIPDSTGDVVLVMVVQDDGADGILAMFTTTTEDVDATDNGGDITVDSTAGFASSGTILVNGASVVYTGTTSSSFTGISGVAGFTMSGVSVTNTTTDDTFKIMGTFWNNEMRKLSPPVELTGGDPAKVPSKPVGIVCRTPVFAPENGDAVIVWSREESAGNPSDALFFTRFDRSTHSASPGVAPYGFTTTATQLTTHSAPPAGAPFDEVRSYAFVSDGLKITREWGGDAAAEPPTYYAHDLDDPGEELQPFSSFLGLVILQDDEDGTSAGFARTKMWGTVYNVVTGTFGALSTIEAPESTVVSSSPDTDIVFHPGNNEFQYFTYRSGVYFTFQDGASGSADPDTGAAWAGYDSGGTLTFPGTAALLNPSAGFGDGDGNIETAGMMRGPIGPDEGFNNTVLLVGYYPNGVLGNDSKAYVVTLNHTNGTVVSIGTALNPTLGNVNLLDVDSGEGDKVLVSRDASYACFLFQQERSTTNTGWGFGDNNEAQYLVELGNTALGTPASLQCLVQVDHNPAGTDGDVDIRDAGFSGREFSPSPRRNQNSQASVNAVGLWYEWEGVFSAATDRQLYVTRYSPVTPGGSGTVATQKDLAVTAYASTGMTHVAQDPEMFDEGGDRYVIVFAQRDTTTDYRAYARRYDAGGGTVSSAVEIGSGAGFGIQVDVDGYSEIRVNVRMPDGPFPGPFPGTFPTTAQVVFVEDLAAADTTQVFRHRVYALGTATFDAAAFTPNGGSPPVLVSNSAGHVTDTGCMVDVNENAGFFFKQGGKQYFRYYDYSSNTYTSLQQLPASGAGVDTEMGFAFNWKNAEILYFAVDSVGGYYQSIPFLLYLPIFKDATATNMPSFDNVVASANESGNAGGFEDADGDGDLDIFIANEDTDGGGAMTGQDQVYLNNGSGVFSSATATNLPVETNAGLSVTGADFDGDGYPDLMVGNNGSVKLYRNGGTGIFTDVTASSLPALTDVARGLKAFQMDNDGDTDVAIAANGQDRILVNLDLGIATGGLPLSNPTGGGTVATNASNVLMHAFRLTAGPAWTESITLTQVDVFAFGTGNDSTAVTNVKLYADTNANGLFEVGVDPQVGSSQVFGADNGTVSFTGLGQTIAAATYLDVFVVYSFSGLGTAGETFLAGEAVNASFTVTGASYGGTVGVSGTPPYQGGTFTLSNALAIGTTSPLPGGSPGAAYSTTITAAGGTAPYTWALSSGTLPAGLTLNPSSGVLSGTPTTAGVSSFNIRATDAASATSTVAFSLTIASDLTITTATYPDLAANAANSRTIAATGGNGVLTFSVSAGSLPSGMTLTSTSGLIDGTPTVPGAFSFTIQVTDVGTAGSAADTATQAYSGTVQSAPAITTGNAVEAGVVGTAYSKTFAATGGVAPYAWALSSGSLPAGLSLAAGTGVLSGTPTASGNFSFSLGITDSTAGGAASASKAFTLGIAPDLSINTTSLPSVLQGAAYSTPIISTGGLTPLSYALTSGSLPAGISLTGSTLAGSATGPVGTSTFTVTVTDSSPVPPNASLDTDSQALSIQVVGTLNITTTSLPDAVLGASYSQTIATTGGTTPFTWTLTAGSLPAGLSMNSTTGAITGTPTATGSSSFTVGITDSTGLPSVQTDSQALTLDVTLAAPTGLSGVAGSGSVSLSWGTVSGAAGYKVYYGDSSGTYSGTAATEGSSPIDVPGGGSNSLTLTGLTNGSTHYIVVTAYDVAMVESAYSAELPSVPQSSTSFTQTKQAPGGVTVAAFRMISFPVTPSSGGLGELEDDLGPYDPSTWRMFAWDASIQDYVEANSPSAPSIQPGRGFWLISKNDTLIDLNGTLPNTGGPFEITLMPGWNLIGSPFAFQVLWDDCAVNGTEIPSQSYVGQELWDWDGTTYTDVPQLVNGRGYWVRNLTGSTVTLAIPPIVAGPGAKPLVPSGGDYSHASTGAPPSPPGAVVVVASSGSSGGSSSAASAANPAVTAGDSGGAGVSPAPGGGGGGGGGGCFAARLVGQTPVCPFGLPALAFLTIGLALWFATHKRRS